MIARMVVAFFMFFALALAFVRFAYDGVLTSERVIGTVVAVIVAIIAGELLWRWESSK